MEEEAADELARGEPHDLLAVAAVRAVDRLSFLTSAADER